MLKILGITIMITAGFLVPAAQGLGIPGASKAEKASSWWRAPSGSSSCLPDEAASGCVTVNKNGSTSCYCPYPQH